MNCLLCSNNESHHKFIFGGKDAYISKLNIQYDLKWFECGDCGVFFSKQYKDIDKVYDNNSLYDAAYDINQILIRHDNIISIPDEKSDNSSRVKRCIGYFYQYKELTNSSKDKYNILDVGAGLGVFLTKMKCYSNFNLNALELNPVAVSHLKNHLNINTYDNHVEKIEFTSKFDLITLNRVLEHISNPVELLKSVSVLLHEHGMIYIELPDSLSYTMHGADNEAFSSGHYMVYNPASIQYLFDKSGISLYAMKRVKEPSGKYTIYAFGGKK